NQPIATLIGEGEDADTAPDIATAMASIKDAVSAEANDAAPARLQHPLTPALSPGSGGEGDSNKISLSSSRGRGQGEGVAQQAPPTEHRLFASPLARRIAQQKGIDIAALKGSGPRGRIVKADVESASSLEAREMRAPQDDAHKNRRGAAATTPEERAPASVSKGDGLGVAPLPDARLFFAKDDYDEIPHDAMRKAIARRLTSSKTLIPHFYLTVDCRIDMLLETRKRLNESGAGQGIKLSVNDFVVKASALALMRVPQVNASWTDTAILRHKHADVGVAVALDFGLITPIVLRAEEKGLAAISAEVKELAERARAKKLKPAEFEGGSFAVSNLGMFGIREFTGVINPPHAAILAVGMGEERAIVKGGKVEAATMMTVTMSCDHRVVDGATGARFLAAFKQFVEDPAAMLL
ncbi:MAG: 2-oxo acid dehydrogenase subunit E2, partial [Alphaproteobacteria bacterium]|nr:2-oxo acid dehydrogenase subunit E2 [Alphaproteobacteria bacterium]